MKKSAEIQNLQKVTYRRQHIGNYYETLACNYLMKQGLSLVTKNFRCQQGELDLVLQEKNCLIIVEVRYRKSEKYGFPHETVTKQKQQKILLATENFLQLHPAYSHYACRFDIIGIRNNPDPEITWIKAAFTTSD